MNSLIFSLNAVMPLFLLVLLGYVIKSVGMVTDEWLTIANKFSFNVTFFILLFYSIYISDISSIASPKLVYFCVISVLVITAICYLLVPFFVKDRFKTGVVIQGIYRTNFLLFGIPLVLNMFGEESRPVTAIIAAVIIPMFNIIAVVTLSLYNKNSSGKVDFINLFKSLAKNPLILGCAFGFFFKFLNIPLPAFMTNTLGQISDLAVPFALIILGGQFQFMGFLKNINLVVRVVLIKLVLVPVIVLSIAVIMGFRGVELGVLIALFTSPGAVSSSIMAYNMDCDGDLAGQIVVFGTIFSVFTIFISIFILKSLSYL